MKKILVINPGSTSTKLAIFFNNKLHLEDTIHHEESLTKQYPKIADQKEFRKDIIHLFLDSAKLKIEDFDCIVGRGGLLRPLPRGGTYEVTKEMVDDLIQEKHGSHASNLGAILAYELATKHKKPAYIVDPVIVDELDDLSRVSGLKGIERISIFHALNQKAIAKRYAHEKKRRYEDLTLIVAHLGGGVSIGLHQHGRVVDVNNALGGDGPFSPERAGGLPCFAVIDMCFEKGANKEEIKKKLVREGGLVSYLQTNNGREIANRIEKGDQEALFYVQAMAYQIVKEIGALYFAANGAVDAIILTGGLVYFRDLIDKIKEYIDPIKPVTLYPGEDEMRSLAEGGLRILNKEEKVLQY